MGILQVKILELRYIYLKHVKCKMTLIRIHYNHILQFKVIGVSSRCNSILGVA